MTKVKMTASELTSELFTIFKSFTHSTKFLTNIFLKLENKGLIAKLFIKKKLQKI